MVATVGESKFGKRKYNRGHCVDGVWILGGVERTAEWRMFGTVVETRDADTLLEVISQHVATGTIVHTDLWRGYSRLADRLDVTHHTVNHSREFVSAVDGTHTNTIEGTWNSIKTKIAPRNRTRQSMEGNLMEFIWRRIHDDDL